MGFNGFLWVKNSRTEKNVGAAAPAAPTLTRRLLWTGFQKFLEILLVMAILLANIAFERSLQTLLPLQKLIPKIYSKE